MDACHTANQEWVCFLQSNRLSALKQLHKLIAIIKLYQKIQRHEFLKCCKANCPAIEGEGFARALMPNSYGNAEGRVGQDLQVLIETHCPS